ncbi:MAG: right-handed parallel beta-helix repeat-containing protein [Janthinobacterium lividum]
MRKQAALASLLALAASLLITVNARATDYFVAPAGSDTHAGTSLAAPFQTITHAVQMAGPGDSVLIRGGTYREQVDLGGSRCGLPGQPLTIRNYKEETVILKGSDVVKGWTLDHKAVWKKTGWTVNSQQVFADGRPLQQIGAEDPFETDKVDTGDGTGAPDLRLPPTGKDLNDVMPGSFYYDGAAHVLYCEMSDKSDPNKHLMEASVRHTVLTGYGKSYVNLHGLSLVACNGTSEGDYSGVLQTDGSHWTIDACTFQYGDFCGVRLGGTDHVIRNCHILDNGDVGINLSGSDSAHSFGVWQNRPPQHILLDALVVTGNNYRHFDEAWHSGGIKVIPSARDVTVRGCKVSNNRGTGIWFDTDWGNIVIEGNFVYKNDAGIAYEISRPLPNDGFGAMIRNNRVIENKGQGIYVSASQGAVVENNTCSGNDFDIVIHGMPRGGSSGPLSLQNNVVANNIVNAKQVDIVLYQGPDASNNRLDGNYYVSSTGQITLSLANTPNYNVTIQNLETARLSTEFERHGKSGDPEWRNAASLDFRLRPGSPAAGKGWQASSAVPSK